MEEEKVVFLPWFLRQGFLIVNSFSSVILLYYKEAK